MRTLFIFIVLLFIKVDLFSQHLTSLRTIENKAFKKGERLKFRVHYGFIDAGEAEMIVQTEEKKIGSRPVHHIVGTGKSNGAFDWFFKVRDRYETYLDEEALIPWLFIRRVEEGSYKLSQNVIFNHYKDIAKSDKKETKVPDNVQDLMSTYFFARTLDFSKSKVGDIYTLSTYLDDEVFTFSFKFLGRETIKTNLGTFRCLKFCPTLLKGRVFKREDDMTCWITDDENKIPIRAEAQILVGSVKMDLMEYEGISNPISMIRK